MQNRHGSHRVDLVGTKPILTRARNGGDGGEMKYRFHAMSCSAPHFRAGDIGNDQVYAGGPIVRPAGGALGEHASPRPSGKNTRPHTGSANRLPPSYAAARGPMGARTTRMPRRTQRGLYQSP